MSFICDLNASALSFIASIFLRACSTTPIRLINKACLITAEDWRAMTSLHSSHVTSEDSSASLRPLVPFLHSVQKKCPPPRSLCRLCVFAFIVNSTKLRQLIKMSSKFQSPSPLRLRTQTEITSHSSCPCPASCRSSRIAGQRHSRQRQAIRAASILGRC